MLDSFSAKVDAIRTWLADNNYDAFIVPHEDEYLGEYIPAHNERLHWLTGFTGSAGAAVITRDRAAMFVDGRYTVQVKKQVDGELYEYCHLVEQPPLDWIRQSLAKDAVIACDPRMHTANWYQGALTKLAQQQQLVTVAENPIDLHWADRPTPALTDMRLMPIDKVGVSCQDKRQRIGSVVADSGADCAVITALDSVCWLLNIRGMDVSRLPVLLSHAILHNNGDVQFFIESSRVNGAFAEHAGAGVSVYSPEEYGSVLQTLKGKQVSIDPGTSNAWLSMTLEQADAKIIATQDPCALVKAAKNSVEIEGMKASHIRDGVAMAKFLSWLDSEVAMGKLHDEATLSDKVQAFRFEDPNLVDLSFDTISAAGSNAAMCHYNHNNQPESSYLEMNSLYLLDSGGQYLDGTTDITRTIAIGQPSSDMINQFTLALKGHIGVTTARFPKGTCGHQIDILARQHLWAQGYDYDHGTGHGVGHFLSVHEGPQSISKRYVNVPLLPGMVLSNEPGYYRADAFGIRIENLELVVEKETNGDFPVLTFEPLTRCPIDQRNINAELLSDAEIAWLNRYHQQVWSDISPLVSGDVKAWLQQATATLTR